VSDPIELKVATPSRSYSVWVGAGLIARAAELIPISERADVATIVSDADVHALHGAGVVDGLSPLRTQTFTLDPGERSKTLDNIETLTRFFVEAGMHRNDLVVSLGGGVVCDVAGFAGAVYHRGVAVAHLPTTLLAQVDAAIGGKTGVNLPEGKNLVGAFHQPVAVLADVTTLETLSEAELRSGLAEVAKHGFIADPGLGDEMIAERDGIFARSPEVLTGMVARAAKVKVDIVERDETESGERATLNYGHTLGHALEALGGYKRWRHGEAVSIGMTFAAALAAELGRPNLVGEHRRVLEALGLPTRGAGDIPLKAALEVMRGDKKYDAGVRFVVLDAPGRATVVSDVPADAIERAYEEVA
jgi:3-dehydroquinate synthase